MNKEEKKEFDILVELGVLQREVRKVDRHIHNNYKRKIYKLEKRIDKAIEYIENLQKSNEELQRDYNKTIDFGIYETDNLLSILRGEE